MPKSNQDYWRPKLKRNIDRFQKVRVILKKMGWRVFVLWECEAEPRKITKLARKIRESEEWAPGDSRRKNEQAL